MVFSGNDAMPISNECLEFNSDRISPITTVLAVMSVLRKNKHIHRDEVTYKSLFQVMCMIRDEEFREEREDLLREEFSNCVKGGMVSIDIMDLLKHASPELFRSYFGENADPKTVSLPSDWSKKVDQHTKRKKKSK